jgi:hypothetical protein
VELNNGTFEADLNESEKLEILLDRIYSTNQTFTDFIHERKKDAESQYAGIDLIMKEKSTGRLINIDEKAQLDYVGSNLPTFAFEISFLNKYANWKKGWLYDASKKTDRYFLITCIKKDVDSGEYTSCRLISVDRQRLISLLNEAGLSEAKVFEYEALFRKDAINGKRVIVELDERNGRMHCSFFNKNEGPINIIMNLEYLIGNGVAKEIVPCSQSNP